MFAKHESPATKVKVSLMPKSYLFACAFTFALLFLTFSDGGGLLPIDYSYVMFAVAVAFCAPFFLRRRIDRKILATAITLFFFGCVSTYGSGVPSAFMYSIGPIFLLIAQTEYNICWTARQRSLFIRWIASILLVCCGLGFAFLAPSYSGRLFLPYVGNPNYTAMLYLTVFLSVQVIIPAIKGNERHIFSFLSYFVLTVALLATQTRSAMLALMVFIAFKAIINSNHHLIARRLAFFLVIFSAIGQLLAYYVFEAMASIDSARSSFAIFDASNLERVSAFFTAMMVVISDPSFIWHGVGNVEGIWDILAATGKVEHVPHNWFMMMWMSNGAIFTFITLAILCASAYRLPVHFIPGYTALLVVAFIVGRAVLFAPLCLFLICGMARYIRNRNQNRLVINEVPLDL